MNPSSLTATQILKLTWKDVPSYFDVSNKGSAVKFRQFAKLWHPDVNKTSEASKVFSHLLSLRQMAEDLETSKGPLLWSKETPQYKAEFRPYELYYSKLALPLASSSISGLALINPGEFDRFLLKGKLPQEHTIGPSTVRAIVPFGMQPLALLLEEVALKPEWISDAHLGWIFSHTLHLLCYFNFKNFAHCDLSEENIFVDTATHAVGVFGGWWCACKFGKPINITSEASLKRAASLFTKKAKASPRVDLVVFKNLWLSLVERGNPSSLLLPYLKTPAKADAPSEYAFWEEQRLKLLGKQKFQKWED